MNEKNYKQLEYLILFKKKCLVNCEKSVLKLYLIRDTVKGLVESYDIIPETLIKDYQKTYGDFSNIFFTKKTFDCMKKEKINMKKFFIDMENTKKEISINRKKLEELNFLIKLVVSDIITNYKYFLDVSEKICNDFINNYKKFSK